MRLRVLQQSVFLATCLCLAPPARADVIVVDVAGGGDFTSLSAAVAAAANGDTLLMRAGLYEETGPVTIDGKSLTILGEWAETLWDLTVTVRPGVVITNLAPNQHVVLANLVLAGRPGTASVAPSTSLVAQDNVSHIRLQSCQLWGGSGGHNNFPSGVPAVIAQNNASLAFVGSGVLGGVGRFSPDLSVIAGHGGNGIELSAGQILLAQSSVAGGHGGSNNIGGWPQGGDGGHGVAHFSGSVLSVGSAVIGGPGGTAHNGGDGGHGFSLGPAGIVWLMGGSFGGGGSGGWSDFGPDGSSGSGVKDPGGIATDFGGTPHGFALTSPLREGEAGVLDLQGRSGDMALLFFSPSLHQLPLPAKQGVLMLSPQALLGPIPIGPPGSLDLPFTAPGLPAGIDVLHVHVQPAYVGPGGTGLGPARVLTILDDSF